VLGGTTTGGSNTSTVYKSAIDTSGNIGTFATTSQGQLPQNLVSLGAVNATIGGTQYVYVVGGDDGATRKSTVYKATIDSSANIGTFATTSQAQLPGVLTYHTTVTASIGGTQYLYVLGGSNGAGTYYSTVYKATIDSSGNVGAFSTTSQGQLLVTGGINTSQIVSVGGTQYLYVIGVTDGGTPTYRSTVYKAQIDSSGNIGMFATTSQGQLPSVLGYHSSAVITSGVNRYLYVAGGYTGGATVSTVYKATIGPDNNPGFGFSPNTSGTLNTSLTAYWNLDETSGNRADSKGTNTLTDVNTVTSATGKVGTLLTMLVFPWAMKTLHLLAGFILILKWEMNILSTEEMMPESISTAQRIDLDLE
jgi:hypothetical protein